MFGNTIIYLILVCPIVEPQPLLCKEDEHCTERYYCDSLENICYQCLQCQDFNRHMPDTDLDMDLCIMTIYSCGPCFKGFVNIYETEAKGQCVPPEFLQGQNKSYYIYFWTTAAITGSFIVLVIVYVLWNTYGFRIVTFNTSIVSSKNLLKQTAHNL